MTEDSGQQDADVQASTIPATGHAALDTALESLAGLADRPVNDHAAYFDAVSGALREVLDQRQAPVEERA